MVRKVLFICLGNICRSPIAHAIFADLVEKKGLEEEWEIDSAAIGSWHIGNQPDHRAQKVLRDKGIKYAHAVRQIKKSDFDYYDYIFGMDHANIKALKSMAPKGSKAEIHLLGEFDPKELVIRDPYYDDDDKGFYDCYEQCLRGCKGFLESRT